MYKNKCSESSLAVQMQWVEMQQNFSFCTRVFKLNFHPLFYKKRLSKIFFYVTNSVKIFQKYRVSKKIAVSIISITSSDKHLDKRLLPHILPKQLKNVYKNNNNIH